MGQAIDLLEQQVAGLEPFGRVDIESLRQVLHQRAQDGQRIAHLVGDGTGQLSERGELLLLRELGAQRPQVFDLPPDLLGGRLRVHGQVGELDKAGIGELGEALLVVFDQLGCSLLGLKGCFYQPSLEL